MGIGLCRDGDFAGLWIRGATEQAIVDAANANPDQQDELLSWGWDFQPERVEYQISVALTRAEALSRLRSWNVSWAPASLEADAEMLLFDSGGWVESPRTLGFRRRDLQPSQNVSLPVMGPLKLQTERLAVTLAAQLERAAPELTAFRGATWIRHAAAATGARFVVVERRGVLTPSRTLGGVQPFEKVRPGEWNRSRQVLRDAARFFASGTHCLALVPSDVTNWGNDLNPADPWTPLTSYLR